MNALVRRVPIVREVLPIVFLAVLALGPLLVAGHAHSTSDGMDSCTACRLANHTPATIVDVVPAVVPLGVSRTVALPSYVEPSRIDPSLNDGRAPPSSLQLPSM